jgi:hypothetical protein
MSKVPTHTLIEWYRHPLTHPVVVEACHTELERRGVMYGNTYVS